MSDVTRIKFVRTRPFARRPITGSSHGDGTNGDLHSGMFVRAAYINKTKESKG